MANIEQLKKKTDEIKTWLEELKNNVTLSETEKKSKAETLKSQAETTKQSIQTEINALSDKTDDESKKKKEEAETLLNSFNETISLYSSVLNSTESKPEEQAKEETEEEKGIFEKAKDWVWDQWDDIWDKEKWKTEWWKNALRTAWFVATWVWAVALAYKGIKSLWNRAFWDDEEEEEEEKTESKPKKKKKSSWWKKWLAAIWIWTAWYLWYKHWDKIKEFWGDMRDKIKKIFEREKPLTIEEAVKSATSEVRNWKIKENPFRQHFEWWITYNEADGTISSYWETTTIDVKHRRIEWLNGVKFPNYEELVHAANIINFARRNFAWKCQSTEPFEISDWWWGDLVVQLANWEKPEWISASDSSLWTKILWAWGCAIWTALWAYILWVKWAVWLWVTLWLWWAAVWDYIDNDSSVWNTAWSVASWTNLKRFKNCLNEQKNSKWDSLWPKKSHQEVSPDDASPIEKELNEIIKEIESQGWEWPWWRDLKAEQDKNNPEIFVISSYHQSVPITLKWCTETGSNHVDYSKIKGIKIWKYRESDRWEWLGIDFPHNKEWLKECIRTANLTNFIRWNNDFAWNWWEDFPFVYWKYNVPFALDMDTIGIWWKAILSHDSLTTKFPTIYNDVQKQFCKTDQDKLREQAFNNKNFDWYESYYIRYLHQMRNEFDSQSYRTNGQQ